MIFVILNRPLFRGLGFRFLPAAESLSTLWLNGLRGFRGFKGSRV